LEVISLQRPFVIYENGQKNGPKFALFCFDFCSFLACKPQHLVVKVYFLSSEPHFVIIIIVSTCLERSKKMPLEPGTPLEEGYLHEKIDPQIQFF